MAELRTRRTGASVAAFLAGVDHDVRRADAMRLCTLMQEVTGEPPAMWGDRIVGFGSYDYRYDSGREGTWPRLGFSPGRRNLTLYLMDGSARHAGRLARLGPHTTGVSCLYLTRLDRVDEGVLREVLAASWAATPMGEAAG